MTKIKTVAIIFTLIFITSLGLVGKVSAGIIKTLTISVQNPSLPPTPPKKPEPPLPPNIPTPTPTSTPAPTQDPTVNPTPGDMCTNIDGFQGSIPDGYYVNQNSTTCLQFQYGGPSQGGSGGGSVTGTGTGGQVLGASTMGGTGSFKENFYLAIMGVGGIITAAGIKNLKKSIKSSEK